MNSLRDVSFERLVSDLKSKLGKISEDMLIEFLMGEENKYMDKTLRNKVKNEKAPFDKWKRESLVASRDWSESRFETIVGAKGQDGDYRKLVKEARSFCKKYIGKHIVSENDSEFIKSIVSYIWLRTPYPEEAFVWTPISNEDYIPWKEKENEIKDKVSSNTLTFVNGKAASGKRKLVNHYLKESEIANYVFAEVTPNSCGKRVEVEYISSGKQEVLLHDFLKQCEWRRRDDYIILTWSYFTEDEIKLFLQWVENNDIKVIVITRMTEIPEGYEKIELGKRPEQLLMEISTNKLKGKILKQEYVDFLKVLHYNPFLVEIFSKYLSHGDESLGSFCESSKKEGETEQLALSKGSKVHSSYRVDTKNGKKDSKPLPIASSLVRCLLPCPDDDICLLCELVVWIRTPIDKEFVIKMGGFKEETIDNLIAKNYLMCSIDKKIQMYPVFVWAVDALGAKLTIESAEEVRADIKASFNEREILFKTDGIQSGLHLLNSMIGNEKCPTMYIQYFYQVIENIICRYHRIYSANTNITDKRKMKYYEQWTDFLEKVIIRLQEMSPSEQAMKVQEKIYIVYKKEKPENRIKIEQSLWKTWTTFVYRVMNGYHSNEEIYNICSKLPSGVDVRMLYPILDICILREIAELALEFAKPMEERVIWQKNPYLLYLLKKYSNSRRLQSDNRSDMYDVIHYYLYTVYHDRGLINHARQSVSNVYWTTRYAQSDEEWMRAQLYFLFFELSIDIETCDRDFLKMKYKHLMLDIAERLKTRSYSANTTSTAIITLLIARAWIPVEVMDGKVDELLHQFQMEEYDLFQKLADVNKYQYQITDEQYQKLLKVIKHSTEEIYQVLSMSYAFKENK